MLKMKKRTAEKKYCPLGKPGEMFCIEKECAWWAESVYENRTGCAIKILSNTLRAIADVQSKE